MRQALSEIGLFWWQAALICWALICLFRYGAYQKGEPNTARVWREVIQAAVIVVFLFGLATEWRGCRVAVHTAPTSCDTGIAGEEC